MELANGLINWKSMGHGINLLTTSINEKINYSQKSREYNIKHNLNILDMINTQYAEYSKQWEK